jgi:hypothetical protein
MEELASKKLSSVWAFLSGGLLVAASGGIACLVVIGLIRGEILILSRHHPGFAVRSERPGEFWLSIVLSIVTAAVLSLRAYWIFRDALGDRKRE